MPNIEEVVAIWNNASGQSGLYDFPFRMYSYEPLDSLEGTGDTHRYKITFIGQNQSTGRRAVPFGVWPDFQRHPTFIAQINDSPFSMLDLSYDGTVYYSQLRLDVWGDKPRDEMDIFCTRFLDLIRLYTNQHWLNSYELNFSLNHNATLFPIDEMGRCLEFPSVGQRILIPSFRALDNEYIKQIFHRALLGDEVDSYWKVHFESQNMMIRGFLDQAILLLVLSVEVARNVNFQRFVGVKKETQAGVVFEAPFDNTDLLKNLGINLKKAINRSLEEEKPQEWESITHLYMARHQVAHGKKAIYKVGDQLNTVDNHTFFRWANHVRSILAWLMELP